MKELIQHLWRSHKEQIADRSLLDCHCKGVHSIMLLEKPESTIRLYVAEPINDLWMNYGFKSPLSVAFHAHHCDLTIHVIKGQLRNKIVEESDSGVELKRFLYHSKIKEDDIKFEEVGKVFVSTATFYDIMPGQSVFMPADTIHTVASPTGMLTAWFVYEGKEDEHYKPYCASNIDLTKVDFSGLYKKATVDVIEALLIKCDLL